MSTNWTDEPYADTDLEESGLCRFYVAGPMTGYPQHNRPAFDEATLYLRAAGYTVVNPVELDLNAGIDLEGSFTEEEVNDFLRRDLHAILDSNVQALVVLEGWEESRGAALEVHVARELGMPCFAAETGDKVGRPTKYRPPADETIAETAQRLVGGDRQDQYGHPIEDFERTAGIINAIYGTDFGPEDIPVVMMAVKLSRIRQSPEKRDSWVDLVGYALTAEMVAERQGEGLR